MRGCAGIMEIGGGGWKEGRLSPVFTMARHLLELDCCCLLCDLILERADR
jgi:acetyl esterase/lipase